MNKRKHPDGGHDYDSANKKKRRPSTTGLKRAQKKEIQWFKGRLCEIKHNNAWFLKPTTELPKGYNKSKDVFLRPDFLPQHILPVMEGDTLEFVLGDRDKTRPMARKVRVSQYTPRTCKEITEYMNKLIKELDSNNVRKILGQVLPCTALWKFFGSPVFQSTKDEKLTRIDYIKLLFKLFNLVLHHGTPFKTLLKDAITNLTQGKIFQEENKQSLPAIIASCNYENNELLYSEEQKTSLSAELVRRFCQDVISHIPSATRCLLPTVTAITKKKETESTEFLRTLLSLNVRRKNGFIVNTRMWMELPSIPTDQELAGHLVEKDKNLTPVRISLPYDDPEQYMDTYFRLIRAETFSAIQHGIKDLKASNLDPRDMNVYHKIYLAGFDLQDGRFSLAIHFTPTKKVRRWEASPQLMFGNLVCLSMNRRFDDVIWATVFNRNTELLNQCQIIMLELLDENVKSISEIINSLQIQGGSGIMVESPTYYHSLSPILRSLKEFNMENFPLQKEIIYVSPRRELPEYLKNATFDTSIVCLPKKTSHAKEAPGDAPDARKDGSNTTEACEKENILEMKATECISSGDAMCIDDPNEIVVPSSDFSCEEKINIEPSLTEKLQFEIPNTKPVLENNTESTDVAQQICINQLHVHEAILNDKSVEHMDFDSILENILYYKSMSKTEQCADSNKTRKSNSLKMHEKRMDVETFLEIFNSSSESSLEASQCDALIHALTNKLAVIQGPPGCGKTFIGVKIAQLLLSLSPKLKKPILLLTYKNHALDEFLKHMLGFCKKSDIVRIGGRSKEQELDECNLKNIQNSIRYEKATLTEIENTRSEIYKIESKIKKMTEKVEESSYLTNRSLVEDLSEEQIRSLILEGDQITKPTKYRVDRRNTSKIKWKEQLLNDVSKEYSSVKEFFQMAVPIKESKESHVACVEVLNSALKHWFPGRRELKRMKDFQTEFILQLQSDKTTEDDESEDGNDSDDDESGDEDHVRQVLETRMTAGGRHEAQSSNSLIIFDPAKANNGQGVLISISDYPPDIVINSQILSVNNLWSLNEVQRLQFLYCILNKKTASVSQELNDLVKKLQSLKSRKEELEITDKVKFLSQKKIIGMTITGASINHNLLHHIGPSVVIVEEAAEILEPSLLAALTPSIEHLVLIGDHKQLRPQVDTYELRKNFQLDVSMMERLIESKFPFESLARQNRMRPEFSALLKDIYPNLQDNLQLVLKNEPLKCIAKSMFFWSHDDPETKDRTYTNVKEADRVIALVKYLLSNGVCPSDITVLSPYLGQTRYLRKMIKQKKDRSPKHSEKGLVQVQTIDNYQGDENKYVIISLVRSNKENNIGFLKARNRRCVAQSRAKCGMYFVGNRNTLCGAKGSCWSGFISSMKDQGCVGDEIPLRCTKHEISKYEATDRNDIWKIMAIPTLLCNEPCGDYYQNCEKHRCKNPCRSRHNHNYCPELVDDQFPDCGHYVKRTCSEDILYLSCESMVTVDLPCGHEGVKKCYQNVSDVTCTVRVTATFPRCGHKTEKRCHVKIETMKCRDRCKEMKLCGKHPCKEVCGNDHGHYNCPEIIDYNFPGCGHPSPKKKSCSQKITWKCRHKVLFTGDCGHEIQRECYRSESEVKCPVTPCVKLRKCGHPCTNACGDDCEKGDCETCQAVYEEKMKAFRKAAQDKYYELEESIKKKEIPKFSRHELHDTGPTAAEHQKVKDQVLKFIQPCHHWFPRITKIEKVTNLELEQKFEAAKTTAFGDYIDTKFHATSNEGVKRIISEGFKMPVVNPRPPNRRRMYGQGIYFATDSSKSARGISTKGSQKLLLCQVILGKSLTVEKADNTLNKRKLELKECDSVYAPRGTEVINDEFVIFDPDQALPQYIIHFSSTNNFVPPSPTSLTTLSYFKKNMKASRSVNFQDPFEMFYNFAESHFRRMAASSKPPLSPQATISSIDIVINKDLEDKFEDTRKKFQADGIPDKEILAYHGTDPKNIESILKSNLQLSYAKRQAYGKGNYFSEFPAESLKYGQGLLLCRILPGKEYVDSTNCDIPQEYNSKKVLRSQLTGVSAANASGYMIIIENSDQILPFFVIHR